MTDFSEFFEFEEPEGDVYELRELEEKYLLEEDFDGLLQ